MVGKTKSKDSGQKDGADGGVLFKGLSPLKKLLPKVGHEAGHQALWSPLNVLTKKKVDHSPNEDQHKSESPEIVPEKPANVDEELVAVPTAESPGPVESNTKSKPMEAVIISAVATVDPVMDLLPDATLSSKMDVLLSKKLKGVTVQEFYNVIWIDPSLFKRYLESTGKIDVVVEPWTTVDTGTDDSTYGSEKSFVGSWCGEDYQYYRKVTFRFKRTTHLYIGPPIASVRTEQWLRLDASRHRCVFQQKSNISDVPFSDCFQVHTRWVTTQLATPPATEGNSTMDGWRASQVILGNSAASTSHDSAISIQTGCKVEFIKPCFVANKIESGTLEETMTSQTKQFESIKKGLDQFFQVQGSSTPVPRFIRQSLKSLSMLSFDDNQIKSVRRPYVHLDEEEAEDAEDVIPPCFFFLGFLSHCVYRKQDNLNPLARRALAAQAKLQQVLADYHRHLDTTHTSPQNEAALESDDNSKRIESELTDVNASLDNILKLIQEKQ